MREIAGGDGFDIHVVSRGLVWSMVEHWGSKLLGAVVFLVLARLVAPEAFGQIALAAVVVAVLSLFIDQGFAQAIVQRRDLREAHLNTGLLFALGVGGALTLGLVALAGPVAVLLGEPEVGPVLRVLALGFILAGSTSVPSAYLQREFRFDVLARRTLASTVVGGVVGVIVASQGGGVWALVAQTLVGGIAGAVALWAAVPLRPRLEFDREALVDLLRFGVPLLARDFLGVLNRRSDDLLIGVVLGPVALGYYVVAYRVLLIATELVIQSPAELAFAALSRLQEDPVALRRTYLRAVRLAVTVAAPVFLGLAVAAPLVVPLIFGPRWERSVTVLAILACIGVAHSVDFLNHVLLTASGRPAWSLKLNGVNAVTNLVAFAIAVRFGIEAVAAAYVIRGYAVQPLGLRFVGRIVDLPTLEFLRIVAVPVGLAGAMAALVWGTSLTVFRGLPSMLNLLSSGILGVSFYLLGLAVLDRTAIREVRSLVAAVRR